MARRRSAQRPWKRVDPKTGKTSYVAEPRDEGGKRHRLGTRRLKWQAQELIDDWEKERQPATTDRSTVGAYAADWTDRYPRSARTDYTNDSRIRQVLDVPIDGVPFRDWHLDQLKRKHVVALIDHMLTVQGRATAGASDILSTLSAMAENAINIDDVMGTNPFKGVTVWATDKRAQKAAREDRPWTLDQMRHFAAAAGPYEPMIRMLADCGFRIGELLALQRGLQNLKLGIWKVYGTAWNGELVLSSRTKQHDREGRIPPTCLAMLRAMPTRIDSPWLFPTPGGKRVGKVGRDRPGGQLWRYDNFRRDVWLPTCERAGIDPTPKEFRSSLNTILLGEGKFDRADVADMLGHSEDVNAAHYTRPLRQSFDEVCEFLG